MAWFCQDYCRLCLSKGVRLQELDPNRYHASRSILNFLLPNLQVKRDRPMLSSKICHDCDGQITLASSFFERGRKSQLLLVTRKPKEETIEIPPKAEAPKDELIEVNPSFVEPEIILVKQEVKEVDESEYEDYEELIEPLDEPVIEAPSPEKQPKKRKAYRQLRCVTYEKYECHFCGMTKTDKKCILYHIRRHHFYDPNNRVACNQCDKTFASERNLKYHLVSHDQNRKLLECEFCQAVFMRKLYLKEHIISMHIYGGAPRFFCEICSRGFVTKKILRNHKYSAHAKKGYKNGRRIPKALQIYRCDQCTAGYDNEPALEKHKEFHARANVPCPICGKLLLANHLKRHLVSHADGFDGSLTCSYCGKTYATKFRLKNHVIAKHEGGGVHCEYCGKESPDMSCLKRHIEQVHLNEPAMCELCSKVCKNQAALKAHIYTVHDYVKRLSGVSPKTQKKYKPAKKFECKECNEWLSTSKSLRQHLESKHFPKTLVCPVCDAVRHTEENMRRHMLKHSEHALPCTLCDKTFLKPAQLEKHLKRHTSAENARYACKFCGKGYDSMHGLRYHERKNHFDKMDPE